MLMDSPPESSHPGINSTSHLATKSKTFGIEETREFLCPLETHWTPESLTWDVIIHIRSDFKHPPTIMASSLHYIFVFFIF